MTTKKNYIPYYLIILFCLTLAILPVALSNNYLRQDDLMWEIWPGMKISEFGYLYYNTVFQLVRPICMLSFYITDLISITIHNAVYVRMLNIVSLGILGIMLFRWQLLFNSNRLLAVTFAICCFTLPPFQIFAATANYFLIIHGLLFAFGAMYFWYFSFNTKDPAKKKNYYLIAVALFFASLFDYPLSSMFGWVLLTICYLNTLSPLPLRERSASKATGEEHDSLQRFFYYGCKNIIFMMVAYYIFSRLFHVLFHVDLTTGRAAVVSTAHLIPRILTIFNILVWHADFWFWHDTISLKNSPISIIIGLFIAALALFNYSNKIYSPKQISKNIIKTIAVCFFLFFVSYSPIFASPEVIITYRYAITTMPILLYITFWSIDQLAIWPVTRFIRSLMFVVITLVGMFYANIMLADGVVGPHQSDFDYVQQQITAKALPLLKENKKFVIHAIDCEGGKSYQYGKNLPISFEYGMRTCQYQQQVIGVTIHSLMKAGYPSNFNQHNTVVYHDNEIIVKDTPWGDLVVNSEEQLDAKRLAYSKNLPVVTIDMRKAPTYNRFEFYKNLLAAINT